MVYTDLEHPETVMESYAYSYDKNSNIVEKTQVNNYPQKDEEKVNETKHYTYDSLGRLVKTVTTDHRKDDSKQTVTYTYDKVGNRLAEDKRISSMSMTRTEMRSDRPMEQQGRSFTVPMMRRTA